MARRAALPLAGLGLAAIAAVPVAERIWPLRSSAPPREPRRIGRNLVLGLLSVGVARFVERPVAMRAARQDRRNRTGLAQRLPVGPLARDIIAVIGLDYTIYIWHVLTHKVPFLWRFHLVHHIDRELSASTAMRFHAGEMLLSIPYRVAQVRLLGVSPRALDWWQQLFFASVLFHHSNMRLPQGLERHVSKLLTTPRMHGIHHSQRQSERDANWSSGLSIWDRLHGTFRLDVPQEVVPVGVPGFDDPADRGVRASLRLPFSAKARHGIAP